MGCAVKVAVNEAQPLLRRWDGATCTGVQLGTRVKIRDVIRHIEADGWKQVRQRGSHRQFKHPRKPGLVTIAGKPGDDLAPGTLNSVLKQAGLK